MKDHNESHNIAVSKATISQNGGSILQPEDVFFQFFELSKNFEENSKKFKIFKNFKTFKKPKNKDWPEPRGAFVEINKLRRQDPEEEEYNVHDFYHTKGVFQKIARNPYFENTTLGVYLFI